MLAKQDTIPKELDRKSLKELKLLLDTEGFNTRTLNTAWKETKNEGIAADIISYIRTLAIGSTLVNHEERIAKAMKKIRELQNWNKVQEKWLDRFEKQLLTEEVIQKVLVGEPLVPLQTKRPAIGLWAAIMKTLSHIRRLVVQIITG